MVKIYKKIISMALVFILTFMGLPVQFMNFGEGAQVYAEEGTSVVDIVYDDFSNTENLQLNGDSLIINNQIQFESDGGTGESVFTTDKIPLGENLSFSTAFSFKNISLPSPSSGTKGGFTFTLQPVDNTAKANDFQHGIAPSLSIAFTANYDEELTAIKDTRKILLASLGGFSLALGEFVKCSINVESYLNGNYASPEIGQPIDFFDSTEETDGYYHVWIGYDGATGELVILRISPEGRCEKSSTAFDLAETLLPGEVYAGFMGSIGDAGNKSEIKNWYFKNDLSLLNEGKLAMDKALLDDSLVLNGNPALDYIVQDLYLPLKALLT